MRDFTVLLGGPDDVLCLFLRVRISLFVHKLSLGDVQAKHYFLFRLLESLWSRPMDPCSMNSGLPEERRRVILCRCVCALHGQIKRGSSLLVYGPGPVPFHIPNIFFLP